MASKNFDPAYWDAPAWTLSIERRSARSKSRTLSPDRPFVLIGSAEHCDIRLNEPQMPPVAYIACCLPDGVEVWPTCAIAFPRWGLVRSGQDIVIGQTKIVINQLPSDQTPNQQVTNLQVPVRTRTCPAGAKSSPVNLPIHVYWSDKSKACQLKRAVTIMGRDQPSVLRLKGQCLDQCDHALVAVGERLWLIDVSSASAAENDPAPISAELKRPGEAGQIGSVLIALGSRDRQSAHDRAEFNDIEKLDIKYVAERKPAIIHAFKASLNQAGEVMSTTAGTETYKAERFTPAQIDPGLKSPTDEQPQSFPTDGSHQTIEFPASPRHMEHREEELRRELESDQLAAHVTDRLVNMSQRRVTKTRGLLTSILSRVLPADSQAA